MLHSDISPRAQPGSNSPVKPPPKAASTSPQFTESEQSSSSNGPDRPEKTPNSAEWLSLDATEPFPPGLFRVPVPNALFSKMPEMSDSALRCLLSLIRLSFRFDPADSEWIHTGDWFTRSDVEDECELSGQGTRNGLDELESIGWVCADRSGRSHWYQLELEVPSQQFTYVPTALLEDAGEINSGTELRVVLAVLRGTWGWTCKGTDPQSGNLRVVHDRWEQLSNRELAKATGRSETAVTRATRALQGAWIERVRPGNGPYQYRFLPEAVGDGSGDPDSFSGENANDLTPDRQKSDPPSFSKESLPKDKHSQTSKARGSKSKTEPAPGGEDAVPSTKKPQGQQPRGRSDPKERRANPENPGKQSPTADFSDLPPEKRDLAEKLHNVGVWAGRIAEILSQFSRARIEANFELYRQRAAEEVIRNPGAWLCQAIVDGYALPSSGSGAADSTATNGSLPALEHKQTLSEAKKDAYVAQGISEEWFHRCLSGGKTDTEPQFMYFDPKAGGPTSRV